MRPTEGIHHITAMAGDAQANRDFYEGVLGLRLVKRTVNFDDPGMHHLYYGDGLGSPGTILTFFPIPRIRAGVRGVGVVDTVGLAVPGGTVGWWHERLSAAGLPATPVERGDGRASVLVADPDGMRVTLTESDEVRAPNPWDEGPVAPERAVQGIDHAVILSRDGARTAGYISRWTGMSDAGDGTLAAAGRLGGRVQVVTEPDMPFARMGGGTVHHIAFRTPDDASQQALHRDLVAEGVHVSPVMDRDYFHSIYFREPGGVLLEVATDPPGFTRDEDAEGLGSELRIPGWLEPRRAEVERALSPLGPAAPVGVAR